MKYIASCSGGKDSVATLILAKEHGEPLDEVVYCEVMFDKDTSGELPEHKDFVYNHLKPFVENEFKIPFTILHSKNTYVDYFTRTVVRGAKKGQIRGYPIPGMCGINRECKIPPIRQYWKSQGDDVIQYIGIALDEPERLARLQQGRISLMEKYKVNECDAFKLCERYDLISPCYNISKRNGCWFCMNCQDREWAHMIFNHESLFDRLISLEERFPVRYRDYLTRTETARQLKERIKYHGSQISIFDL